MAFPSKIALNDVIRCTYRQNLFGQRLLSVIYLQCTQAPPVDTPYAAAMENLAQRLGDVTKSPITGWRPLVGEELEIFDVRVQRVWPTRDVYFSAAIAASGINPNPVHMSIDAVSITKRTLLFGEAGVGRLQMGGVPINVIEEGHLTAAYRAQVDANWSAFFLNDLTEDLTGAQYRPILFHGAAPQPEDAIREIVVGETVRTMHRRTVGLGE